MKQNQQVSGSELFQGKFQLIDRWNKKNQSEETEFYWPKGDDEIAYIETFQDYGHYFLNNVQYKWLEFQTV